MLLPRANRRRFLSLGLAVAVSGCAGSAYYDPTYDHRIITAINFDFNSYRIRPESYALLDNTAIALNDPQLTGLSFEINGHTDVSGRLGYNIALSMLRATSVVDYLASRGVPRGRMRPQGFGPLQLLDQYNPRSPANRRVEIVSVR